MPRQKISNPLSIKFKFYRFIMRMIYSFFIKTVRGLENLPKEGAFIIASNHASMIDPPIFHTYCTRILKRHIHFLASAKFYKTPIFRDLLITSQSIKVTTGEEARALITAIKYLRDGEIVGVFPEGARSFDGKIKKGRTGVASLALSAKVPVVPIGLINTHKVLPSGKGFFKAGKIAEINIGKPIRFEQFYKDYDEATAQDDRAKITDIEEKVVKIIMREIARLSNQEYPY